MEALGFEEVVIEKEESRIRREEKEKNQGD